MKPTQGKSDACADAELLIQQSLDAPLRPAERQRLDRHLATCESCRQAWDEYRRLARAADQWVGAAAVDPGDDFTKRVMADLGIPDSPARSVDAAPAIRSRGSRLAWGIAATVVVAAVAGGFAPQVIHAHSAVMNYASGLHSAPSITSLRIDALSGYDVARPDLIDVLMPLRSWTWPVYAFVGALAANVMLAIRQRRRAL